MPPVIFKPSFLPEEIFPMRLLTRSLRPWPQRTGPSHWIPTRTASTWARTEPNPMSELSPGRLVEGVVFTPKEHLGVQHQIERRARLLWYAGGCRQGTALHDWLQAEREVLEQFIRAYARRRSSPQSSRQRPAVTAARERPDTRILKRGR